MLFLPSSVRLFLPLLLSHVSSDGRVKSSEETLIGSDFSLSRLLPPLLYPRPYLTMFLKSSPLDLELGCPRKYFRVDAIRRRERIRRIPDFCTFFSGRSSISADRWLADPFPFRPRRSPSTSATTKFFVALFHFPSAIPSLFLSSPVWLY